MVTRRRKKEGRGGGGGGGGVTALAAGIYTTREGAKVIWSYVDRILGQPSLIRESSRGKYPCFLLMKQTHF